jgi:hypothetical protein
VVTTTDRTDSPAASTGFSVLDGAALVAGAAVAAAHLRGVIKTELVGPGWVVVWGSFLWIGLTAAGPFIYLFRLYLRQEKGYPKVGDRLWAMLGLPWLLTTVFQGEPGAAGGWSHELLTAGLSVGLGVAGLIAVAVVWGTWVMVTPQRADQTFSGPWTNRVGLLLAIAWPVQCGLGMVVMG